MTPEEMAGIHAAAMRVPPPWNAATIRDLSGAPGAVLVTVENGFALGRVVLDEAELLSIAVDPASQGEGLGKACLRKFIAACAERGATRIFLEVAADNPVARKLYQNEGFAEVGLRRDYYAVKGSPAIDAVLMSKTLDPDARPLPATP